MQPADECPGLQSPPKKPAWLIWPAKKLRGAPACIEQRANLVGLKAYAKGIDARIVLGK
jgi:hypothetical protein